MKHMRLWSFCFVLLVLTSTANAEICDIRSAPRTELAGRSFYMELPGGRAVLVIGEATMNKEEHEQAVRLLAQAPQGTEELNKQVSQFLQERRQVVESAQIDFAILQQSLQQRAFNYLALESAPDALAKWTDKASDLYMDEAVRVRFGGLNKADGDRLLLITLGPALFLKADQPKLFTDVALMGIDLTLEPGPPPPSAGGQAKDAAARKADEVMDKLEKSKKSLRSFKRIMSQLKPGSSLLRKKSDAEIKQAIVAHFWRPARREVSEWVELKLASLRQKAPPATIDPLYGQLMARKGNGLLLVFEEQVIPVSERLELSCKSQHH
jgi:hypothetical protein